MRCDGSAHRRKLQRLTEVITSVTTAADLQRASFQNAAGDLGDGIGAAKAHDLLGSY